MARVALLQRNLGVQELYAEMLRNNGHQVLIRSGYVDPCEFIKKSEAEVVVLEVNTDNPGDRALFKRMQEELTGIVIIPCVCWPDEKTKNILGNNFVSIGSNMRELREKVEEVTSS